MFGELGGEVGGHPDLGEGTALGEKVGVEEHGCGGRRGVEVGKKDGGGLSCK